MALESLIILLMSNHHMSLQIKSMVAHSSTNFALLRTVGSFEMFIKQIFGSPLFGTFLALKWGFAKMNGISVFLNSLLGLKSFFTIVTWESIFPTDMIFCKIAFASIAIIGIIVGIVLFTHMHLIANFGHKLHVA